MKNIVLAFALVLSFAGASMANTTSNNATATATTSAREIANVLQLNEAQYLKVRSLENARLGEVKSAQATLTGEQLAQGLAKIQEKYKEAVLQVLTPAQQKVYLSLETTQVAPQLAQVK